jgi:hypothetical protein
MTDRFREWLRQVDVALSKQVGAAFLFRTGWRMLAAHC